MTGAARGGRGGHEERDAGRGEGGADVCTKWTLSGPVSGTAAGRCWYQFRARGASTGRWRGSGGRGARRSPAWMPGQRLRHRLGRAPPGDGVELPRHLAGPERTVVHVDASDGPARHRTALGEARADVELRIR